MHHEILRHIHYRVNWTFILGVLVLIPHSRESLSLLLLFSIILVLLRIKNSIITMIVNNFFVALFIKQLLKIMLTHHCLICTNQNLIFNPNYTRCGIAVDGTALK